MGIRFSIRYAIFIRYAILGAFICAILGVFIYAILGAFIYAILGAFIYATQHNLLRSQGSVSAQQLLQFNSNTSCHVRQLGFHLKSHLRRPELVLQGILLLLCRALECCDDDYPGALQYYFRANHRTVLISSWWNI